MIAKLEWAKLGESERQIEDVAGIIRTQGSDLDFEYLERWIAGLALDHEWLRAKKSAGIED